MNPYTFILSDFYGDTSARFGADSAAVLLLRVLADGYTGTMPVGENPYRWVLQQLSVYGESNDFLRQLSKDWHSKANPHV